jgi:hypothetical protein
LAKGVRGAEAEKNKELAEKQPEVRKPRNKGSSDQHAPVEYTTRLSKQRVPFQAN